jgi:hypothetical protein
MAEEENLNHAVRGNVDEAALNEERAASWRRWLRKRRSAAGDGRETPTMDLIVAAESS